MREITLSAYAPNRDFQTPASPPRFGITTRVTPRSAYRLMLSTSVAP
jgi:hypothetical protein